MTASVNEVLPRASIQVVVVDDEPPARRSLSLLLQRDCEVAGVHEIGSGAQALAVIRETRPDLVLRAFDAGALDYLLKPFDDARFFRALARAKERIAQARVAPPRPKTLVVKSAGRVAFVKLLDVDWIEAADYYSRLHCAATTHLLRRSMTELERELDADDFIRIHRSAIVRRDRIAGIASTASGEYEVVLADGTRLPLSRRQRRPVLALLGRPGGSSGVFGVSRATDRL